MTLRAIESDRPPQRFGVFQTGELVGTISAAAHADVAAVIDSGLEFHSYIEGGALILAVADESAPAAGEDI